MKTVAYLRVSTDKQDLDKNKADILMFANERDLGRVHFVEDIVSGKVDWRQRKIGQIVEDAQEDDALLLPEISRLGRSVLEVIEILAVLQRKGVRVYALKGNWQLDNTLQSKILATVLALVAEIERDFISLRTKEGLAARKRQGIKLGRPRGTGKSKLDKFEPEIRALLANGSTVVFIADRYKTTTKNLYRWMKAHGITRPAKKAGA